MIAAPTAGAGSARKGLPARIDRAEDCDPRVPHSVKVWTGSGSEVVVNTLVLLDGVLKPDAQVIVDKANASYRPLNITIQPEFRKVELQPGVTRAEELIAAARTLVGGARPEGTDVVYVLTTRDLSIAAGDVVGYADCIGGIRYANRSFAISESFEETLESAGVTFYRDGPAKTLAHEIGHLLGARHEHANCVQGAAVQDVSNTEPTVCTLMTNYLDLQSSEIGTAESFIIRSYAEAYALP
jgi:predicted Zn-dependent protease